MKITDLYVKNFRKHASLVEKLGDVNNLFAGNGQGKSSVAEAIVWMLFGTDIEGTSRQDARLIKAGETEMRVGAKILMDTGVQLSVERIRMGDKTELKMNSRTTQQKALEVHIGNFQTFMSAFWPGYFGSLDPKDGRHTLMQILPRLAPLAVIEELMTPEDQAVLKELDEMELYNVDKTLESLRKNVRSVENELNNLQGQYQATMETSKKPLVEIPAAVNHQDAINKLQEEIVEIKAGSKRAEMQNQLNKLKADIGTLRADARAEKAKVKAVPASECPTCKQKLPENEETKKLVEEICTHNTNVEKEYVEIVAKGKKLADDVEKLEQEFNALPNDEARIKDLQAEINKLRTEETNSQRGIATVTQQNKQIEDARTKAGGIAEQIEQKTIDGRKMTAQIDALGRYRLVYADHQIDPLIKHLNRTTLKLNDVVQSTGEIKPVFHVYWKNADGLNVPYRSLSTSEKIRCNLEISRMISLVKGENYPVFVDNAESIVDVMAEPIVGQVFTAYVDENMPFTIETEDRAAQAS